MVKIILSFLLYALSISTIAQVDFKNLQESSPIELTKFMTIYEYKLNGTLYTGDAIQKSIFGSATYHFQNGKKHGIVQTYYKNENQKAEENYDNGALTYSKMWLKDGTLISETLYNKGYLKSQKRWHSNSQLDQEVKYRKKGTLLSQVNYYKTGMIKEEGKQKRTISDKKEKLEKTGKWKYYDKKGAVKKIEKWKKGELINKRKK
jgi:antitoxin component YwqK of YwqJK toxin-antitoxin module